MLSGLRESANKYIASYELKRNEAMKQDDTKPQLDKWNKRLSKIKELFVSDLLPLEEYRKEYEAIHKALEEIKGSIKLVPPKRDFTELKKLIETDIETMYESLNQTEKREFWASLIKKFYVFNGIITDIEFA